MKYRKILLSENMWYVPFIEDKKIVQITKHFDNIMTSILLESTDRLKSNYTYYELSKSMIEYGHIENELGEIIYMAGTQDFENGNYRVESRTYIPPKFRTKFWRPPDNYALTKYQIKKTLDTCNMHFKSRESLNPNGHLMSARIAPDLFSDWKVVETVIELKYKDNWQWIMYKNYQGNYLDNIDSVRYKQ